MGNKDVSKKRRCTRKRRFRGNKVTGPRPQAASTPTTERVAGLTESTSGASATAKKIRLEFSDPSSDKAMGITKEETFMLINMSVLQAIVGLIGQCPECSNKCIEVSNDLSRKKGFAYLLILRCKECLWQEELYSSCKILDTERQGPKNFEVNTRMVVAFREFGKGLTAMETFTQCMNMPNCICQKSYDSIQKSLLRAYKEVSQWSQSCAAKETRKKLGVTSDDAVTDLNVSVDGTWQTRGFSSLNGVVTLMSSINGKCLDTDILSKKCRACQYWTKKKGTPEYERWKNEHSCTINHRTSSGAMEVTGAINMFQRSVDLHKLKYTGYIGDGDSKAYQNVSQARPYGDVEIKKLECIGHVQKRMGTRLRNLVHDMRGKKLTDGKPLCGKNRLTKKRINTIQNYYGLAIRQNIASLYAMKKSVFAILFHFSENSDLEDRHKCCPRSPDSWCKYQSDKITKMSTYKEKISFPPAIKSVLLPIFKDLAADDLLSKCLHGQTQNVNEALHQLIWQKCPKAVYVERLTIEIATASAVLQFNDGATGVNQVVKRLGILPGKYAEIAAKKRNRKRLNDSLRSASLEGKQKRRKLRSIKKGYEDKEEEQEDQIYASGAF